MRAPVILFPKFKDAGIKKVGQRVYLLTKF